MKKITQASMVLSGLLMVAGCATMASGPTAKAEMMGRSGTSVTGQVSLQEVAGGLHIRATVSGLVPGEHGFHVHEVGDCSAPDGTSAKGHFNPTGHAHGHHAKSERHAGDLPNLVADSQGNARYDQTVSGLSLSGANGVLGRALVIHADPDDYKSQPAGNSGKRVSCGVITSEAASRY